jgi:diguanylate cyclase (GGDEF)-like protein
MNYDNMTREDLIAYIEMMKIDRSFNIIKKEAALYEHGNLADGETVILIDIACMHAMNHKYTMNGTDQRIRNFTQHVRESDVIAKFGGDELVIIVRSTSDITAYTNRLNQVMRDNELYGVMAVTTSCNGLENTFNKLDAKVSACKLQLELSGLKPDRNQEYTCGESWIVYC